MNKLKTLKILITGAGAPGAPGIIKSLRLVSERKIIIFGIDADIENSAGKGLTDYFFEGVTADDPKFINLILDIAKQNDIDIIIPLVTKELFILSENKEMFNKNGIKIIVSDRRSLEIVNNKYKLMVLAKELGIPIPTFKLVHSIDEFIKASHELGYPNKKICFKPPISNGMRGFRIISDTDDKLELIINEKPNNVLIGFDEFINIAKDSKKFPELLLMEYLPGEEFSVDVLADGNKSICVIPRKREKIKMGISFVASTFNHPDLINYSQRIVEKLGLYGNIGFQFKEDASGIPKLIESNPRVQGTIVLCTASGYNMVYNAVKIALNETPETPKINWNTKMIRYWDEIYIYNNSVFKI